VPNPFTSGTVEIGTKSAFSELANLNVEFRRGEDTMKPSTKNQIKGELHEIKGKAKEKVGQITNNPNMVAEGRSEKLAGKIQKKVGRIEKVFGK
jgi:uncharacterized protein YjbJ (UPF0337 family)